MRILSFHYLQLHLVKRHWRTFIESDNPAAAALLSKMGYTEKERVQVKLEFLRMLTRKEVNPAKTELLYGFFETYLKLNAREESQMRKEIDKLHEEEAERVLELPNMYKEEGREQGIEEGIEQGKEQGIKQGKEQMVRSMIEKGLSDELIAEIAELEVIEVKERRKRMSSNEDS